MATIQKPLAAGQLGAGTLEIYTNTSSNQQQPFLVITNAGATLAEVEVLLDTGTGTPRSFAKRTLPAGAGKNWRVLELSDVRLGANHAITLTTTATINYFLSGIEFDTSI